MKTNIGGADRWIRMIIGLAILVLGFAFKSWWGLIGLLPLGTALFRFCALYTLLGMNTNRSKTAAPKAS